MSINHWVLMKYLNLLSKSRAVDILLGLQNKKLRFADIAELTGNATTATRRLKEMAEVGIVNREVQQDASRTVFYELTKDGIKLAKIASDLKKMG